jgi:hypothetical protein
LAPHVRVTGDKQTSFATESNFWHELPFGAGTSVIQLIEENFHF